MTAFQCPYLVLPSSLLFMSVPLIFSSNFQLNVFTCFTVFYVTLNSRHCFHAGFCCILLNGIGHFMK